MKAANDQAHPTAAEREVERRKDFEIMSKTSSGKAKRQLRVQRVVSRATVETYYAVRIGTPGRNLPYFMVRHDDHKQTPWLFTSRTDAETQCPKQPGTRVVKVRVSHG